MAKFTRRSTGAHSSFTIHIQGEPTNWEFRRVSALEEAQIQCDLQPLNAVINKAQREVMANYRVIQRAEEAFERVAEGTELDSDAQDAMSDLARLDIAATVITADMLAPVYGWLAELLTTVDGFEDEDSGAPLVWSKLDEADRSELVEMLSGDHATALLEKVRAASHLSGEAQGKSRRPSRATPTPAPVASAPASSAPNTGAP